MTILIVGGGKFGIKAIEYSRENNETAIIIDKNPQCQAIKFVDKEFKNFDNFKRAIGDLNKYRTCFIQQNVEIINELFPLIKISHVIPVIPIHLMVYIITTFFSNYSINFIPEKEGFNKFVRMNNRDLILSSNIEKGIIYLSHAKQDEICPDDCFGPPNYCPHFKREKKITITHYLREFFDMDDYLKIEEDDELMINIILESYQLKAGLGGLLASEVINILAILKEKISIISQKTCKLIIGTTCNCHGVLNFLEKKND